MAKYRLHMPSDTIQVFDEEQQVYRDATGAEVYRDLISAQHELVMLQQKVRKIARDITRLSNDAVVL